MSFVTSVQGKWWKGKRCLSDGNIYGTYIWLGFSSSCIASPGSISVTCPVKWDHGLVKYKPEHSRADFRKCQTPSGSSSKTRWRRVKGGGRRRSDVPFTRDPGILRGPRWCIQFDRCHKSADRMLRWIFFPLVWFTTFLYSFREHPKQEVKSAGEIRMHSRSLDRVWERPILGSCTKELEKWREVHNSRV